MTTKAKHDANKFTAVKEAPESARDLRAALLAETPDRKTTVTLPSGRVVEVRELSAGQRSRLSEIGYDTVGTTTTEDGVEIDKRRMNSRFQPFLLIACCHDPESGEQLFGENDVDALNAMKSTTIDPLVKAAMEVSKMDKDAEESEKNDSAAASGDSSTTSH